MAKQKSNEAGLFQLVAMFDQEAISSIVDDAVHQIQQAVCKVIAAELAQLREMPKTAAKSPDVSDTGVLVTEQEKAQAIDYRAAVLMGKVPENAGLLLNSWDVAKLMSVSRRTWAKLHAMESIPAPVRIGRRTVRWRLAEIVAWIDSGCPPRSHWRYPEHSSPPPKSRK